MGGAFTNGFTTGFLRNDPGTGPLVREQFLNSNGTSTTNFTVAFSTTPTQGNLMVACIGWNGSGTLTPPAGWTLGSTVNNFNKANAATYYKVAGASETTSYTFTSSASGDFSTFGVEYSSNGPSPFDVTGTTKDRDPSPILTSITPSSGHVVMVGIAVAGAATVFSSPTNSYSIVGQGGTSSVDSCLLEKITTGGSSQTSTMSMSGAQFWATSHIAFVDGVPLTSNRSAPYQQIPQERALIASLHFDLPQTEYSKIYSPPIEFPTRKMRALILRLYGKDGGQDLKIRMRAWLERTLTRGAGAAEISPGTWKHVVGSDVYNLGGSPQQSFIQDDPGHGTLRIGVAFQTPVSATGDGAAELWIREAEWESSIKGGSYPDAFTSVNYDMTKKRDNW